MTDTGVVFSLKSGFKDIVHTFMTGRVKRRWVTQFCFLWTSVNTVVWHPGDWDVTKKEPGGVAGNRQIFGEIGDRSQALTVQKCQDSGLARKFFWDGVDKAIRKGVKCHRNQYKGHWRWRWSVTNLRFIGKVRWLGGGLQEIHLTKYCVGSSSPLSGC